MGAENPRRHTGVLGLVFKVVAKKNSDGRLCDFYFSLSDYKKGEASNSDSRLLSLGSQRADWFEKTNKLASEIYEELIEDIRNELNHSENSNYTERQIEILFGLPAYGLSNILAKSIKQVELLKSLIVPDTLDANIPNMQQIKLPLTSADVKPILASREVQELCHYLVLNKVFGLESKTTISCSFSPKGGKETQSRQLIKNLYLQIQKAARPLSSRNRVLVIQSYLGRFSEFWLALTLGQWPSFFEVSPSQNQEKTLSRQATFDGDHSIRSIAQKLLFALLPVSLMEHREQTRHSGQSRGFPKAPSVIFTSNSFEIDDEFKVHLAENLERARYIVGQHGNNYGISKFSNRPENTTNDIFLSWGWVDEAKRIAPVGVIKPAMKRSIGTGLKEVCVFLDSDKGYFFESDTSVLDEEMLTRVKELMSNLNSLEVKTVIRPHSSSSQDLIENLNWEIKHLDYLSLETKKKSFKKIVNSRKLIVFAYDSTGMLEMGVEGTPFFLFASQGLGHVKPKYLENYELLRKNEMLSVDPYDAAKMIKNFLENDSSKFIKEKSQAAKKFTEGIAFKSKSRIRKIRAVIKNEAQIAKELDV